MIRKILNYLSFGSNEIRYPDIAIQPLIELNNGFLALSPFIWCNSDVERNFCVLMNQIPIEKNIYLKLTLQKEQILRDEIEYYVKDLGYEVAYGELDKTDLDIAIIDREQKVCICLELKWFIEPAEIREIIHRSEELEKGVSQAKKILLLYQENDIRLIREILKIDNSYEFMAAVGSRNWIGHYDVQNGDVPIIKVGHFLEKIRELENLREVFVWLKSREFLPKESIDYKIIARELTFGKWSCSWYGIQQPHNILIS